MYDSIRYQISKTKFQKSIFEYKKVKKVNQKNQKVTLFHPTSVRIVFPSSSQRLVEVRADVALAELVLVKLVAAVQRRPLGLVLEQAHSVGVLFCQWEVFSKVTKV